MWGNLGSSAMGSTTLRSTLSEASIPQLFIKKKVSGSHSISIVPKTNRHSDFHTPSPERPPSYPPPPVPSSPCPSTSSSGASSSYSSVSQGNVEGHGSEKPLVKRLAPKKGARLKGNTSDSSEASFVQHFKRGGFQRSSLYRSGRCKSMPSIVTIPATPLTLTEAPNFDQPQRGDKSNAKKQHNVSSSATTPSSGIDVTTPSSGCDVTLGTPRESSVEVGGSAQALTPRSPKRRHQNSQGSTNGTTGHERRFKRRFPKVGLDEDLVDHYSCALLSDILLQGVLYISPKFFAFYSNIFGYKTQYLIPVEEVLKVTKERTAKIIPNAVGIITAKRKYVFGSLLTRDATFKTMYQVWTRVVDPSLSEQEVSVDAVCAAPAGPCPIQGVPGVSLLQPPVETLELVKEASPPILCQWFPAKDFVSRLEDTCMNIFKLPRTSLMLLISTLLLVVLFASASVVIYRITLVHRRISAAERRHPDWMARWTAYQDIHKKQNKILTDEVQRLTSRLKDTINQLNQMRLPLEELLSNMGNLPDYCRPPDSSPPQALEPPTSRRSDNSWLPLKA